MKCINLIYYIVSTILSIAFSRQAILKLLSLLLIHCPGKVR